MKTFKAFAILLLTVTSWIPALAIDLDPGIPFVRYFSTRDYDGGIQNWSLTQSKTGLVYVANNFGVLEYDGSSWRRYTTRTGSKVRHISIGADGKIYVASQGDFGYLFPDKNGLLQYISLSDSLNDKYRNFDETWRVFIAHDKIIFCTFKNIFIYEENRGFEIIEPQFAPENFFYSNHQLYINQLETGLSYLDGNEIRLFPGGEALKGVTVTGIINLPNNELWVSTLNNGIFIYNGKKFKPWRKEETRAIAEAAINCAIRLRNGNYAIGTQNEGVYIISPNGKLLLHLDKSKGINNRTVLSLFEDAQDNLWMGHNNGISFIELGMPFTYINEQAGLPGTGYAGFLDGDNLYLGTNNGLYTKNLSDGTTFGYQYIENTEGQVYSVSKINDHLLIGHHNGAFELKDSEAIQLSGILGAWTFLRLKSQPEYIIEGTYKGLVLHKIIDGKITFQHTIKGFDESSRVMAQDEDGSIWMTHGYKGVYKLELNEKLDSIVSIQHFDADDGLPSNLLVNVFKIRNQLVFTTQNQIYRFNKRANRFVLDEFFKDFFINDPIIALAEDPFQNIYYLTQNEIGVLEKKTGGEYIKNNSIFNKLRDMLNDDLQNISVLSANKILYGAKEGFILYDAGKSVSLNEDFPMLIRKVSTTGAENDNLFDGFYVRNNEITAAQTKNYIKKIPHENNSVQFQYSAAFIDGLDKTEYQYWLENSEKTWSEWTAKTEKEYTNLKEGKYIFHVRARNIYGNVSNTASYAFIVEPPFYRTNLAYTTYGFSIFTFLFASFYLFDKKHRREKSLMSIKQQKELSRKETEIENIAKESASEIERLKNEKLIAEIENKNKELATSTMHLINKNSFISGLKNNLMNISKRSKNQEVRNELRKIMTNIDKNISQDDDWEHFLLHFDQVHGDFSTRLKEAYSELSPQEMKLAAYLRMNLSTKEMAHLLNISIRGVEICRYRLRKKLNLHRTDNLQEFILKF